MPLPPMVIEAPALPAMPAGLLDAALGPLDMPAHLQTSGGVMESLACGEARLYPTACDDTPPYPTMTPDDADPNVVVYPFVVYASVICGTFGHDLRYDEQRARARLQMGEARAVELAFWGSGSGDVPGIVQQIHAAAATPILADAPNVVEAVSLLEQQMATVYGGVPLIHARPRMGAYLGARGVLTERNPARTHYGSVVVLGAGYSGIGPDGTAVDATSEFMLATGRVTVWRSEVVVPGVTEMVNTTTNQRRITALRNYAIAVECGVTSVQVTRA